MFMYFFFFKQKTAYEMRISDWTSDVCSSDLLMVGTAGLPHVIVRFFTVPKVSDARKSAGWALVFIALLYTVAPAVGAMARLNILTTLYPEGTRAPSPTYEAQIGRASCRERVCTYV